MKNLLLIIIAFGIFLIGCDVKDDPVNDIILPEFLSFSIVHNNVQKPCEITVNNEIFCKIPYGSVYRDIGVQFTLSESDAKVYRDNVEQMSGVTINDFYGIVSYDIIASDGERTNTYLVSVDYEDNTEAILYEMFFGIDKFYYSSIISETNKTITVDFYNKNEIDLINILVRFVVSDNASLHLKTSDIGIWFYPLGNNNTTINILKYIDGGIGLRTIAENTDYYTDYNLIVKCNDCGN